MRGFRPLALVLTALCTLAPGPCDSKPVDEGCFCEDLDTTLTAVSGCENFGGDEEECSGWHSCEDENGVSGEEHESGTELTCFGCTIRIDCGD